jgi:hypothetical protein
VSEGVLAWLTGCPQPVQFVVDPADTATSAALGRWLETVDLPGASVLAQRRPRLSGALNDALGAIRTTYVHWCGVDDQAYWWRYPDVAARLDKFAGAPTWIVGRCETARATGGASAAGIYRNLLHRTARWSLPFTNVIGCPAVIFRTDQALALGGFDEDVPAAMDYDMWVRLFEHEKPLLVPYALGRFTITTESLTRAHRKASIDDCYRTRRRYFRHAWVARFARGVQAAQLRLQDLLGE